jgi:hypothetical protein
MSLAGHEVPTVFVQGHAPPAAVRDAEARLQWLCAPLHSVRYSVLWIQADRDRYTVGVELGIGDRTIEVDATATTIQDATNACMDRVATAVSAPAATVSR